MKLLSIALGLAIASAATANPGWKRINYTKSTIFNATVTFNGQPAEPGDCVGVFVNDECRMIAPVKFEGETSYVSAVVHSETAEQTKIMLYRASDGKSYEADSAFTTVVHGQILGFPIRIKSGEATSQAKLAVSNGLVVYPSPFVDKLSISADVAIAEVRLISIDGTVVARENAGGETFINFDNVSIPSGKYTVSATMSTGEIRNCEIIKE